MTKFCDHHWWNNECAELIEKSVWGTGLLFSMYWEQKLFNSIESTGCIVLFDFKMLANVCGMNFPAVDLPFQSIVCW